MQKVALVGLGFMGMMHAQAYRQLANVKIAGIVDSRKEEASQKLTELGLKTPIYPDLATLLQKEQVDFVDVCLPTDLHPPFCEVAIEAGKHVFCEKPISLSVESAEALVKSANKANVKFMVGHCIRFWPEYQVFETFVKKGEAGKLLSLTMQRRAARPAGVDDWMKDPARSMGAALDLHIHDVDYIHHLVGKPKAVTSIGTHDFGGWSHIFTNYLFDNVAITAEGGWNQPQKWGFEMAFQAVFENGSVEFCSNADPSIVATIGNQPKTPLHVPPLQSAESIGGIGNISSLGGYYNELAYFVDCLETDREPQIATAEQATESLKTVLAEIKSAETGRIVEIK